MQGNKFYILSSFLPWTPNKNFLQNVCFFTGVPGKECMPLFHHSLPFHSLEKNDIGNSTCLTFIKVFFP